jgi:ribosome-binding protein aMBF1 (putative translation factor)
MLKVDLPKGETRKLLTDLGACLDFARRSVGWTVDQLAAELNRDSKQVARWMRGEERCQVDVVFGVRQLRGPFVIALAQLAECDVVTTISVRRTA